MAKKKVSPLPVISKSLRRALDKYIDACARLEYEQDRGTSARAEDIAIKDKDETERTLLKKLKALENKIENQRDYINHLLEKRDIRIVELEKLVLELPVEAQSLRSQMLAILEE